MRVTVLGTGGGDALMLDRAQSGVLVDASGHLLLLDCGAGTVRRLMKLGVDLRAISAVWFTHYHADHMLDFPHLVLFSWVAGRTRPLAVHGPEGLRVMSEQLFGPAGVFGPDIEARIAYGLPADPPALDITEVADGDRIPNPGPCVVTAARVPHSPSLRCLAYRIDHDGRSVVFSGDSMPSESMVTLASDAQVLIHECTHLDEVLAERGAHHTGPDALGDIAGGAGVRTLVLTHFHSRVDDDDRAKMITAVRRNFTGDVVVGRDGLVLDVPGPASW